MPGLSRPGPETAGVDALLKSDTPPGHLSRMLLDVHLHTIATDDPESADLATTLALPRFFDAEIVGVLRGGADPSRDYALLERLRDFSLVVTRRDGTLAYHDTLRHLLLQEWHRDAADEATVLNRRLIEYHSAGLAEAERLRHDLEDAGDLIVAANPARYTALIAEVRARTLSSLREAQYHSTAVSSQTGYEFFSAQCARLEAAGRISLCAELVRAAREDVEHPPVSADAVDFVRYIDYWEARVAADRGCFEAALGRLQKLEAADHGDSDRLRLWTLLLLGNVRSRLGDREGARTALARARELVDRVDPDPHSTPLVFDQSAYLETMWLDLGAARKARLKAIAKARAAGNHAIEITSRVGLAELALREGDLREALIEAFTALDLARTTAVRDPTTYRRVLEGLIGLVARVSPDHLATLRAELSVLHHIVHDDGDPGAPTGSVDASVELTYAEAARSAGLLATAAEALDRLDEDLGEDGDDLLANTSLAYVRGRVRHEQGCHAQAAAAYGALIDAPISWHRAAGWTNKGIVDLEFDPPTAEAELREAVTHWEAMGHANYVALARALRARALALLGRHEDARAELVLAESRLDQLAPELEAEVQQARAALLRADADWAAAAETEAVAAAIHERLGAQREQALALWREAGALAMTPRWGDAAERAGAAIEVWRDIESREHTLLARPEALHQADEEDAAGVRGLFRTTDNEGLHRARASFRRATDNVRDDPWYNLNLAYTCAALGDWTEAQYAMDRVTAQGAPWDNEVLVGRCNDFRTQRELAGQEEGSEGRGFGSALLRRVFGGLGRE